MSQVEHNGECTRDALVDHERANDDLFAFQFAALDQRVLLVEKSNKTGTIMSSVTFCRKDESG